MEWFCLGLLPEFESSLLKTHLEAGCDSCLARLVRIEEEILCLNCEANPVAPPPSLKPKLMRIVSSQVP